MKGRAIAACGLVAALMLAGCRHTGTQSDLNQQTKGGASDAESVNKSASLTAQDFCVDGVTLATTRDEFTAHRDLQSRQLGGYDYSRQFTEAYLAPDGKSLAVLQSYVQSLCTFGQRFTGGTNQGLVTREQVLRAYGEPFKKGADGDEYWFYVDKDSTQVLVFQFLRAKDMKTRKVQVARYGTAKRQWYPLLGEVEGPRPLTRTDAALGPLFVGMDPEKTSDALGDVPSEGDLLPYHKQLYRDKRLEIHFDIAVRAIYIAQDATLATPRGIRVGSATAEVRNAYGEARVASDPSQGELWSYESLGQGVGLVFWIKQDRVVRILAADSTYEYRPRVPSP